MAKKRNRIAATEEQAPTTKKDRTGKDTHNEIDEIFAKAKKPKSVQGSNPPASSDIKNGEPDEPKDKKKKKKINKNENDWPETPSTPRRKTNDGFSIYSADELGFNKKDSGGTALCPFDCDCCF